METKKYTFWQLLDKCSIEIPIIQRDYAQGRVEESRIRDNFLEAINKKLEHASNDSPINLDFIYGRIIDHKLTPLDGQQRLTTLFLLHWYLAVLAVKGKELDDNIMEKLQKFTYETRVSSREFCKALSSNPIDLSEINDFAELSKLIEDKNWFFKSWKKDPTIKSMLNMLDAIHKKFTKEDLFDKLVCEHTPQITFDFLPLDDFNLTDELYIKMNARGKPLTAFENFKANFQKQLDEKSEIKYKIDNQWQDIFWSQHKEKFKDENEREILKNIDDSYFNFFKNITIFFALNEDNTINNFDQIDVFQYKYQEEDIKRIEIVLDSLSEEKQKTINGQVNLIRENINIFEDFLKPYTKKSSDKNITYEERMRFYVLMLFFVQSNDLNCGGNFKSWMRVSINLINNTVFNDFNDFKASMRVFNELSNSISNIYHYLHNHYNTLNIRSNQFKEEVKKAQIILDNEETQWEDEFLKAEKNWYLDGDIGFLLDLANKDDGYNIDLFKKYRDRFIKLWDMPSNKQHLIQRALLTFSENNETYIAHTSHRDSNKYTLCTFGKGLREKNENWRKVFNTTYFKKLLNSFTEEDIEKQLNTLINQFTFDSSDWRSFLINPNKEWHILCDIRNCQIQINSRDEVFLNKGGTEVTNWGWSRVAELRGYYVYKALKEKDKNFEYHSVSVPHDVCLYLKIPHNNPILELDIKYAIESKEFISELLYLNSHHEPNLLNNLFKLQTNLNDDTIETVVNRIQKFQDDLVKHCMAIS